MMMNWRIGVPCACALAAASPAQAENWFYLDETGDQVWYVDGASIKVNNGITSVSYLQAYLTAEEAGAYNVKVAAELRCTAGEARLMEVRGYDQSGRESSSDKGPGPWGTIREWTLMKAVENFACSKKAGKKVDDPFSDARAWRAKAARAQQEFLKREAESKEPVW